MISAKRLRIRGWRQTRKIGAGSAEEEGKERVTRAEERAGRNGGALGVFRSGENNTARSHNTRDRLLAKINSTGPVLAVRIAPHACYGLQKGMVLPSVEKKCRYQRKRKINAVTT